MVPGGVAIVAALLLRESDWQSDVEQVFGPQIAGSTGASIFLFLVAAYVAGQLISPFAKFVQRLGESSVFGEAKRSPKNAYDWLRLNKSEAGSQCAKIRAEFTMHNSLAVVFAGAAVLYPFSALEWQWPIQLVLVAGAVLAAVRGRTTRDTFHDTVSKFYESAHQGETSSNRPSAT